VTGPQEGRVFERFFKGLFGHRYPLLVAEVQYFRKWQKVWFAVGGAKSIPWANGLARITTEHPSIHFSLRFFG
jgi:hypothetical protein